MLWEKNPKLSNSQKCRSSSPESCTNAFLSVPKYCNFSLSRAGAWVLAVTFLLLQLKKPLSTRYLPQETCITWEQSPLTSSGQASLIAFFTSYGVSPSFTGQYISQPAAHLHGVSLPLQFINIPDLPLCEDCPTEVKRSE